MNSQLALIDRLESECTKLEMQTAPDTSMVWRRWGSGKPLILLHGGAGSWLHWVHNIDYLARTRTVWAPDMPGFGDSGLPSDGLDADSIAPIVHDGLEELLRGERFDLVGFSFGALVAGYVAALRPATLDSLILVSAAGLGLMADLSALKPMRGLSGEEREAVLNHNLQVMMISRPERIDALARKIQDLGVSHERVRNRRLAHTDILPQLAKRWRGPVHAIWATEDSIYKGRTDQLLEKAAELGLRSHALVQDAGHWVQYEDAPRFNAMIKDVLAQADTRWRPA